MAHDYKRILFISFDHIGDILRFTPLLKTLRRRYPRAYIAVVVPSRQSDVLRYFPYVNTVIDYPHDTVRQLLKEGASLSAIVERYAFSFLEMLRRQDFDLVINPFMEFGAVIAGLLRPRNVLGRIMTRWGEYKVFGEHAAKFYYMMERHNELRVRTTQRFSDSALDILKDIGASDEDMDRQTELAVGGPERRFAAAYLADRGIGPDSVCVGLQMGAMLSSKRLWPVEKFIDLARRAHEQYNATFVLVGSAQERPVIDERFCRRVSVPCINAAGETTLLQAAALLSKLAVLVTNDSGPMHMAAAVGTPVVALFGKTSCIVNEARPNGDTHTVLVGQETKDIPVADVLAALGRYLGAGGKQTSEGLFAQ